MLCNFDTWTEKQPSASEKPVTYQGFSTLFDAKVEYSDLPLTGLKDINFLLPNSFLVKSLDEEELESKEGSDVLLKFPTYLTKIQINTFIHTFICIWTIFSPSKDKDESITHSL